MVAKCMLEKQGLSWKEHQLDSVYRDDHGFPNFN